MNTTLQSRNVLMGIVRIALIFLFATSLHSCNDEQTQTPINHDGETTISFSVSAPQGFNPVTYTLSNGDESQIETIDVLLFETGGGDYVSGPHYGAISGTNVTIRIPESTADYDMVILANCREEINGTSLTGDKETLLATLTRNVTPGDGGTALVGGTNAGWITTGTDKTIPMWAETTVSVTGSTATVTNGTNLKLVRMLSRITVKATGVDVASFGKTSFTLADIYLCNYNDAGRIAPSATNWSTNAPTAIGTKQTGDATAIKYTVTDNKSLNDIYTFETETNSVADPENPCIVIAGTFDSEPEMNYYRIDLVNNNGDYLALLRNHSYDITITKISGVGSTDLSTALSTPSANIETSVMRWNDNTIGTIVVDSKVLGVSQGSFTFDAAARDATNTDNTLIIVTENLLGSTLVLTPNSDGWLSAAQQGNAVVSGTKTTYTYKLLLEENDGSASRAGTITITVDRLEYVVGVEQSNISPLPLTVTDLLDYYLLDGEEKGITIRCDVAWRIKNVTEKLINGSTGGALLSDAGDIVIGTSGDASSDKTLFFIPVVASRGGVVEITLSSQTSGQFDDISVILPFAGKKAGLAFEDVVWAGSNIYYDPTLPRNDGSNECGHLTFAANNEYLEEKKYYQGVFFRWGSLYGIAPVGNYAGNINYGTTINLYPPKGGIETGINWEAIPYISGPIINDSDNNYLYYRTDDINSPEDAVMGDICRWLTLKGWAPGHPTSKWRMPTRAEFYSTEGSIGSHYTIVDDKTGAFEQISNSIEATDINKYGQYQIPGGRTKDNISPIPFFPASGYRISSNGQMTEIGSGGHYRTSSPMNSSSYRLRFNYSSLLEVTSAQRNHGFTVRCVKESTAP